MTTSTKGSFRLLTLLFFMWGFITVMNDILVNTFQGIFDLTPTQRALVQMAFFGAFFIVSLLYFTISSIQGKDPINRIGYNNGMVYSLWICGMGCLLFYPAAQLGSYAAFLGALFVLATGVTLLQICANPYAAILGSESGASSRLNLAQGLNSLGTTLGPLVGVILIYQVFSSGEQSPESVGKAYLIYGIGFLLLGIWVKARKMPSFQNEEQIEPGLSVLKNRHLLLGIFAIFFYVGSEVSVGTWLVEFLKDKKIAGMSEAHASYFLSYFWGGLMIGRLMAAFSLNEALSASKRYTLMGLASVSVFTLIYLVTGIQITEGHFSYQPFPFREVAPFLGLMALNYFAFVLGRSKPARTLMIFCTINCVLLLTGVLASGYVAAAAIIGTGLFFSIGWSNVFTLAIKGLGKFTTQGSSLLVMAIVGGAALPWVQSRLIESTDVKTSFIIPVLGMLYLIYYGFHSYKRKHNTINQK